MDLGFGRREAGGGRKGKNYSGRWELAQEMCTPVCSHGTLKKCYRKRCKSDVNIFRTVVLELVRLFIFECLFSRAVASILLFEVQRFVVCVITNRLLYCSECVEWKQEYMKNCLCVNEVCFVDLACCVNGGKIMCTRRNCDT